MKLYTFALSPNCQKVVAVARELDLALDCVHVDIFRGDTRTPTYLAKDPNGRVPLLEDNGLVLSESNAILFYLAGRSGAPSLLPSAPRDRAEILRWLFWESSHLSPAITKVAWATVVERVVRARRGGDATASAAPAKAALFALLRVLDRRLERRAYVVDDLSIADFALAPVLGVARTCGVDVTPYAHLCAWLERMSARASMRRTNGESAPPHGATL
jgi:glutathione S-transferase